MYTQTIIFAAISFIILSIFTIWIMKVADNIKWKKRKHSSNGRAVDWKSVVPGSNPGVYALKMLQHAIYCDVGTGLSDAVVADRNTNKWLIKPGVTGRSPIAQWFKSTWLLIRGSLVQFQMGLQNWDVAHSVERPLLERKVAGSIPAVLSNMLILISILAIVVLAMLYRGKRYAYLVDYEYVTDTFFGDGDHESHFRMKIRIVRKSIFGNRTTEITTTYTASMFQSISELSRHWDRLIKEQTPL